MADAEPVAWEHHASKLVYWLHCMSYNDSYFGEPAGLVKQVTGELNRLMLTRNSHAACQSFPQRPQWVGLTDEAINAAAETAWRAGWAACRDAAFVGQEAEDDEWGMNGANVCKDIESALRAKNGGSNCPKCGSEEWDLVSAERGRERDVPFNRCNKCENEWQSL